MDGSLADMMQEMGYSCCATMDECRKSLLQFGTTSLSASAVARVISMMGRTHSTLTDSMPLQVSQIIFNDGGTVGLCIKHSPLTKVTPVRFPARADSRPGPYVK